MLVRVLHEATKWWVAIALTGQHLSIQERGIVMAGGSLYTEVLGVEGLHQNTTRRGAPSCASSYLSQQLESPLASAEVWKEEGDVGRDNANKRHGGKVQPL